MEVKKLKSQYVMIYNFEKINKLISPLVPFLSEDAYQNYPFRKNKSVFFEI